MYLAETKGKALTMTTTTKAVRRARDRGRWISAGAAVLLAGLVVFQIALAAGAPVGRAAYGGATDEPGLQLRISSVFAAIIWSFAALVILSRGGHRVPRLLPDRAMPIAMWLIVGLLSVGLILNLITPSQLERLIWAPVSAALVASTVAVELAARRGRRSS